MASGSTFYLPPRLRVLDLLLPTRLSLPSPFAAFFLRPAQIACFGLDVQEAQNTAQKKKTGKMREEKQDTLSIIFILLCSLLGSASRVQVAVRLRCELAYDINGMRQRRGGAATKYDRRTSEQPS